MDFLRVNSSEAIVMKVPVHIQGAEQSPGVKAGGSMSHLMNEIEIKCLPKDLPEFISIDVSSLELDHSIHLSEVKLPTSVEILQLIHNPENDFSIL